MQEPESVDRTLRAEVLREARGQDRQLKARARLFERPVRRDVADRAGTENMTWECDFPHSDSDWPFSPEAAEAGMRGLDDSTVNAITHENAMRLFQYEPFAHRPKAECTVGALRAEAAAAGIDTAFRSMRTRAQTMGTAADAQIELLTPGRS